MTNQYNSQLVGQMIANGEVGSHDSNDDLYPRVAAGDKAAIKQMIESNMSLVISKVDSYVGCFP